MPLIPSFFLPQAEQGEDASAIAVRMAPQRAAAAQAAQLAVFRAVPQHAWLASQLVSQWVGPEAAISDGAVRRWAPVAEVVKETCRWVGLGGARALGGLCVCAQVE